VIFGEEFVNKFIFDVDGTLTPSRQEIDSDFAVYFSNFCVINDVYLVTGSDKEKTVEQVGEEIYSLAKRVYNCSGSDVWEGEKNVYTSNWQLPHEAEKWLRTECRISEFPLRTGLHIEKRPGMVNFSVVGRNATMGERKLYVKHDVKTNE
jgi:phosphomannomutase